MPTLMFALISLLHAAELPPCTDVRLDQGDGPFARMPVYNQLDLARKADSDICYAIAGAQLITANRMLDGEPTTPVAAPLSVSMHFKTADDPPDSIASGKRSARDRGATPATSLPTELLAAGPIGLTMDASRGKSLCDQRWLEDFVKEQGPSFLKSERIRVGKTRSLPSANNLLAAILEESDRAARESRATKAAASKARQLNPYFCARIDAGLISAREIIKASVAASKAKSPVARMTRFLDSMCKDHTFTSNHPPAAILPRGIVASKAATSGLDLARDRNRFMDARVRLLLRRTPAVPVGLTYLADVAKNGEYRGISEQDDGGFQYRGSVHSSVIVGQRAKGDRCEFLVRDSYGSDCTDKAKRPRYAHPCENGSFWIDSEALIANTMDLSWLPSAKPVPR